jgi:AcrR family transcriptional regulator
VQTCQSTDISIDAWNILRQSTGVSSSVTRKQQQAATTRALILRTAQSLLAQEASPEFLHDRVAAKADIAARTVYRHFPTQADLIAATWQEWTRELQGRFPSTADEVPGWMAQVFRAFDKHAPLVRAWLAIQHTIGDTVRRDAFEREDWARVLRPVLTRLTPPQRGRVVSAFQTLCSPSTWDHLRTTGQLSYEGAAKAVEWVTESLIRCLHP